MRNKILIVLAVIAVFSLGVLSVRAWDKYKVEQRIKAQYVQMEQARQVEQQKQAEVKRAKAEASEKKKLQETCKSLEAVYEKLTPFQKTQVTKPDCTLKQLQ